MRRQQATRDLWRQERRAVLQDLAGDSRQPGSSRPRR
jgi:hypothetical protein